MCNTIGFRGSSFPRPVYVLVPAHDSSLPTGKNFLEHVKAKPVLTGALPTPTSLPHSLRYMQWFVPISSNSANPHLQPCKPPHVNSNTNYIELKIIIKTSKKKPSQLAVAPLDVDLLYIQTQRENNSASLLSQGNV